MSNQNQVRYHKQNPDQIPFQKSPYQANAFPNDNQISQADPFTQVKNQIPISTQPTDYNTSLEMAGFNERRGFIVKVYSLISMQMLLTFLLCLISYYSIDFRNQLSDPITFKIRPLIWVCFGVALVTEIAIFCCKGVARKVPTNYILLFIFTLSFGLTVTGSCSICYNAFSNGGILVVISALMTLAITLTITLYACTTKTDFTMCGGALWMISIILLLVCIFSIFYQSLILQLIISGFSVLFYGFYLIYDTQLIAGGKSHELSIDDYVIGAMIIYIDIMILFLRILEIMMILFGKN